jgi:hypothetical protein
VKITLNIGSTSALSDVVQVLFLVFFDTFCIDQLPDESEARIIPDYGGPDCREQLKHHLPLLTFIKIHYCRFDLIEFHGPRSLLPEGSYKALVKFPKRFPGYEKRIAMADTTKIVENQPFFPWGQPF